MVQGELFEENNLSARDSASPSFFSKSQLALSLDKIILLAIAFVVLFALTYSFGFERGQRSAERKMQALSVRIDTLVKPVPAETGSASEQAQGGVHHEDQGETAETLNVPSENETPQMPIIQEIAPKTGKYTIQLATALSKELAEKEVAKLEKRGIHAFFIQRGRYFEVCTGSFESVASAKSPLSEFKAKGPYSDAFIRPASVV